MRYYLVLDESGEPRFSFYPNKNLSPEEAITKIRELNPQLRNASLVIVGERGGYVSLHEVMRAIETILKEKRIETEV